MKTTKKTTKKTTRKSKPAVSSFRDTSDLFKNETITAMRKAADDVAGALALAAVDAYAARPAIEWKAYALEVRTVSALPCGTTSAQAAIKCVKDGGDVKAITAAIRTAMDTAAAKSRIHRKAKKAKAAEGAKPTAEGDKPAAEGDKPAAAPTLADVRAMLPTLSVVDLMALQNDVNGALAAARAASAMGDAAVSGS